MVSAMNLFNSLVDDVGDQRFMLPFSYMSPFRHTLAFNLSKPPCEFNFVLSASFMGTISFVGNGLSDRLNVLLSISLRSLYIGLSPFVFDALYQSQYLTE